MINELDEAFYRNKRAGLVSSLVLIAGTFSSVHIDSSGQILNAFKIENISSSVVIIVLLLVSTYLNFSYFLHYITEIPQWRRSPGSGLAQVEALRQSMIDLREQAQREELGILNMREASKVAIAKVGERLSAVSSSTFATNIESAVVKQLSQPLGAIQVAAFNQLSAAIRKDAQINLAINGNLKWAELADRVVAASRDSLIVSVHKSCEQSLNQLIESVDGAINTARQRASEAATAEDARFALLKDMVGHLSRSEGKLRRWASAMNLRLRVQYLIFPILLYMAAITYSLTNISCGGSLRGCQWFNNVLKLLGVQ